MQKNRVTVKANIADRKKGTAKQKFIRPIEIENDQIGRQYLQSLIGQGYTDIFVHGESKAMQVAETLEKLEVKAAVFRVEEKERLIPGNIYRKRQISTYRIVIGEPIQKKRRGDGTGERKGRRPFKRK